MNGSPAPIAVGIFPAAERERRRALLAALEVAFPVRFEGRGPGELRDLGAVVDLTGGGEAELAAAAGIAALSMLAPEPEEEGAAAVQDLAAVPELDQSLRGAKLPDARLGTALRSGLALAPPGRATVLASHAGEPTWVRAGRLQTALLAPQELGPEEALRERLCENRSAALLPLTHFLRELTATIRWRPPAASACMLFDDPNLHWPSYGYVKLAELGRHAQAHRYHVALATIPLDAWFAHRGALRALAASEGAISLLVHGNDHDGGELGRAANEAEATALAAQALRRVEAFERRTGVAVDRLMVPPHEECSEATVRGLLRCGFEGISMTRPYPWLARPPRSWLARPAEADALVGWRAADFTLGLPLLLRHPLSGRSAPELALRAFLGQPLILYGHHDDLREGLDVLAAGTEEVNRLGQTRWCRLGEIARGAFESRHDGSLLTIRPLSNGVRVEVPEAAERLAVEPPPSYDGPWAPRLIVDGRPAAFGEPVEVDPGTAVAIELRTCHAVDVGTIPSPRRRPLALARRIAGEGRDRLAPLTSRSR